VEGRAALVVKMKKPHPAAARMGCDSSSRRHHHLARL